MLFVAWVVSHFLQDLNCPDELPRQSGTSSGAPRCRVVCSSRRRERRARGVVLRKRRQARHRPLQNGVLDGPAEYSYNNQTVWRRDGNRDGEAVLVWHNPVVASLSEEQRTTLGAGGCGNSAVLTAKDKRALSRVRPRQLPKATVERLVDGGTAQGSFDRGARSGEWFFRDQRGNLIKRAEFSRGALNSSYREWYPDGRLKTEGQYLVGQKWGTWRSWSEKGAVSEIRYVVP